MDPIFQLALQITVAIILGFLTVDFRVHWDGRSLKFLTFLSRAVCCLGAVYLVLLSAQDLNLIG